MVSAFNSGSRDPGSSPGRGHCVVFLGKTLYSHSASLHPGPANMLGITLRWTSILSRPKKGVRRRLHGPLYHMYMYTYIHAHTHTYIYIYIYIYVYIYIYIC